MSKVLVGDTGGHLDAINQFDEESSNEAALSSVREAIRRVTQPAPGKPTPSIDSRAAAPHQSARLFEIPPAVASTAKSDRRQKTNTRPATRHQSTINQHYIIANYKTKTYKEQYGDI